MFVPIRMLIPSWRNPALTIFDSENAGEIIRSVRVISGIRRKRSPTLITSSLAVQAVSLSTLWSTNPTSTE